MSRIIAFDVNETLLDMSGLDPVFERLFGAAATRSEWFAQVLQSAMTTTILGEYQDFSTIAGGALTQVAQRHGVTLKRRDRDTVAETLRSLPAHPDVEPALERLGAADLRLVALTNSPDAVARDQIANAGLERHFEAILSVDMAQTLKPAREVYNTAARSLLANAADMRLVAAHGWDIAGALHAGWHGAFVARPGQTLDPLFAEPDIIANDLAGVADAILERDLGDD